MDESVGHASDDLISPIGPPGVVPRWLRMLASGLGNAALVAAILFCSLCGTFRVLDYVSDPTRIRARCPTLANISSLFDELCHRPQASTEIAADNPMPINPPESIDEPARSAP